MKSFCKHLLLTVIFSTSLYGEVTTPRLSPVPAEVHGISQVKIDLNGQWDFNPLPSTKFWKESAPTGDGWAKIQVPGEWVMQGFVVPDNKAAAYFKQFAIDSDWAGKRVKLRCNGVYSYAKIWINGIEVGSHLGGFTPFELDVTDAIKPGKTNYIAIAVESNSVEAVLSSATYYALHELGGISRDIMLFAVEKANIASMHINTAFDHEYKNATLQLAMQVANESSSDIDKLDFKIELTDPTGHAVKTSSKSGKPFCVAAGKILSITFAIPVSSPAKWDSEHTNLYTLLCTLMHKRTAIETIVNRFGFRQIEVRGNQVFVNNFPIKLRGVDRHEIHPLLGRAQQPKEAYCRDVDLFRQANVNYIRTSHYSPPQQFLDACDELGMLVEVEAPFCWVSDRKIPGPFKDVNLPPNGIDEYIAKPTLEMLEAHRNHPSVIIWSLANESWTWRYFEISARYVKEVDPSRPRNFSQFRPFGDANYCEIGNAHYPGLDGPKQYGNLKRPIIFDEYVHVNCYNRQELVTDPGLRDFWGSGFTEMWNRMYKSQGCLGGAIWCGIDEVFFIPDGNTVGYGMWGIIDEWRRPKPEYWHVKKAYSPVQIPDQNMPDILPGKPLALKVENRHNFTNLSEVRFEWICGNKSGQAFAKAAPRAVGTLQIPLTATDLSGKTLIIKAVSPQGYIIDEYQFKTESKKPVVYCSGSVKPTLITDANEYIVKTSNAIYKINRQTGTMTADVDNKPLLLGGPELMLLPFTRNGAMTRCLESPIYEPYTASCTKWHVENVAALEANDAVVVTISGDYKEVQGKFVVTFDKTIVDTQYDFTSKANVNPRQIGLAWRIAKTCDTLKWDRKAQWSVYPEDHIGRPTGTAKAFSGIMNTKYAGPRIRPTWQWSQDETSSGSNDFRSTKVNIFEARLIDANGVGITVISNGTQHFRSWIEDKTVKFLVADYANEGGESIFSEHMIPNRPIKNGDQIKGTVSFCISGANQK